MVNILNMMLRSCILQPAKHCLKPVQLNNSILKIQARTLFTPASLGIDGYEEMRNRTKSQLVNITDKFKIKMHEYTTDDSTNMIFTEDLRNMIHIAEDSDIELVIKMMNRFNKQNKQLRFGNYVFGPVVMRMFSYLNKPKEALECFNSPDLGGFFDQLTSYHLLLDLLYDKGMYKEVIETFQNIIDRQIEGIKYAKNNVVLVLAACYKINTKESLKFALDLWKDLTDVGHKPTRRAYTFCSALALNQGHPEIALEILSSVAKQNYTTVRNLKVAAFVELGKIEDTIPILKGILEVDWKNQTDQPLTFNKDVLDKLSEAIEKVQNEDLKMEFKRIMEQFREHGHISEVTLDEQLCTDIDLSVYARKPNQMSNKFVNLNRFQRSNNRQYIKNPKYTKPGLNDLQ